MPFGAVASARTAVRCRPLRAGRAAEHSTTPNGGRAKGCWFPQTTAAPETWASVTVETVSGYSAWFVNR
ncbi:hypothetical protein ACFXAF_32700 [Kitasatospora sp. NPDC059463]|uniref:hypothetical protein n=1 Tax=Kitasatospora sp. NPDC059463 TaxID=3346842 RepID=UPI003687AD5E